MIFILCLFSLGVLIFNLFLGAIFVDYLYHKWLFKDINKNKYKITLIRLFNYIRYRMFKEFDDTWIILYVYIASFTMCTAVVYTMGTGSIPFLVWISFLGILLQKVIITIIGLIMLLSLIPLSFKCIKKNDEGFKYFSNVKYFSKNYLARLFVFLYIAVPSILMGIFI